MATEVTTKVTTEVSFLGGFRLVTAASLVTLPALSKTCIFGQTHEQTDMISDIGSSLGVT